MYKMVYSEYSTDNIAAVIKNQKMLKFVPDHLKTKKCVNMQLKHYHL